MAGQEPCRPCYCCPLEGGKGKVVVDAAGVTTTTSSPGKEGNQLKVLCFNVFTGCPLPFYGNTSPSLEDSERLRLQIDHLRRLSPDILCLQEVCSDGVER